MAALFPVFRPRHRGFVPIDDGGAPPGAGPAGAGGTRTDRVRLVAQWQPDPTGRPRCRWNTETAFRFPDPPH